MVKKRSTRVRKRRQTHKVRSKRGRTTRQRSTGGARTPPGEVPEEFLKDFDPEAWDLIPSHGPPEAAVGESTGPAPGESTGPAPGESTGPAPGESTGPAPGDFGLGEDWLANQPDFPLPPTKSLATSRAKPARGTKRRRKKSHTPQHMRQYCRESYCRKTPGHGGPHSDKAERLRAMSPEERYQYHQRGNAERRESRAKAHKRGAYCPEPYCNRLINHPGPCSRKTTFVRCSARDCHRRANHKGDHSLEMKAKAIEKEDARVAAARAAKARMPVYGRDTASQTDLGVTGVMPSQIHRWR